MALKDYEQIDEDDFYGQPFDKEGVVSVWVGLEDKKDDPEELDILQDLCGVGYYNIDFQEINFRNQKTLVPIKELITEMSYSDSFVEEMLHAAERNDLDIVRWVLLQYDFAYNPMHVKRTIYKDPVFLGCFEYKKPSL